MLDRHLRRARLLVAGVVRIGDENGGADACATNGASMGCLNDNMRNAALRVVDPDAELAVLLAEAFRPCGST